MADQSTKRQPGTSPRSEGTQHFIPATPSGPRTPPPSTAPAPLAQPTVVSTWTVPFKMNPTQTQSTSSRYPQTLGTARSASQLRIRSCSRAVASLLLLLLFSDFIFMWNDVFGTSQTQQGLTRRVMGPRLLLLGEVLERVRRGRPCGRSGTGCGTTWRR